MNSIGTFEILIIFTVVLLLFGGNELPRIARSIAKVWRDLQRATQSARNDIKSILEDEDDNSFSG